MHGVPVFLKIIYIFANMYVGTLTQISSYTIFKSVNIDLLFIYSLLNDAFSVTQTVKRQMKGWQANDEFERTWKKWSWPNLRYYSSIYLEALRKTMKTQNSLSCNWDLNPVPPEYKAAGVITTRPPCSAKSLIKQNCYSCVVLHE
jgi:hypothetical protein